MLIKNECYPFLCNECEGHLVRLDDKYMLCPKCQRIYNELEIVEFEEKNDES